MNNRWCLRVVEGDWVLWGYGPRIAGEELISPAATTVPVGNGGSLVIPFTLPHTPADSSLPNPEIYERTHKWGWRFETTDIKFNFEWLLADTRDAAMADAARAVQTDPDLITLGYALEERQRFFCSKNTPHSKDSTECPSSNLN